MNKFSVWGGTRSKTPAKTHSRPNRALYNKLQPHSNNNGNSNETDTASQIRPMSSAELQFFASDDTSSDEEEIVAFQLEQLKMVKHKKRKQPGAHQKNSERYSDVAANFVEREIQNGDTLPSLSLRYGCKVSEIKRINNLINDQEFFGLRNIKVPVKEHGLVKEQLEKENSLRQQMKQSEKASASSAIDIEDGWSRGDSGPTLISIRRNQDAKDFLQKMDADLERIRQTTKIQKDTLEEAAFSLTCKRFHPFVDCKHNRRIPNFKVLVILGFLGLVVIPIIFISVMVYKKHLKDMESSN